MIALIFKKILVVKNTGKTSKSCTFVVPNFTAIITYRDQKSIKENALINNFMLKDFSIKLFMLVEKDNSYFKSINIKY